MIAPAPAAHPPAPDRRGDDRHRAVLLIGRVEGLPGAPVCVVLNLSCGGLCARFGAEPAPGATLVVEVRGLAPAAGTVRWAQGRRAGLAFADRQDLARVFGGPCPAGHVARAPRFPLAGTARLCLDGRTWPAAVADLSAGGTGLTLDRPGDGPAPPPGGIGRPRTGQAGAVLLPGGGTAVPGRVAWAAADGRLGFRFAHPLPLARLCALLAEPC